MPGDEKAMTALERFQEHLRELFQLDDTADLDFGIYRLFTARREEVEKFINKELPEEVESAFNDLLSRENVEARETLKEAKDALLKELPDALEGDMFNNI